MTHYSRELSDRICEQLASGRTLRSVCKDEGMPTRQAVQKWIAGNVDDFAARYADARQFGYAAMEDEIIDLSDDAGLDMPAVTKARLQVDSRKWVLAKSLPKRYGDRTILAGDRNAPLAVTAVEDTRAPIDTLIAAALVKVRSEAEAEPGAEKVSQIGTPLPPRELPRLPRDERQRERRIKELLDKARVTDDN